MNAHKYYSDDSATLYLGDALAVARTLPDASVNCIVTSPPYFGLRDYGEIGQYGLESTPAEYVETMRALFHDGSWTCGDWECEKCTEGDGHHGPVCDYCSFSTDDDTVPSVVFWPCTTVQIIDGLPAPGLRAALDPQETP